MYGREGSRGGGTVSARTHKNRCLFRPRLVSYFVYGGIYPNSDDIGFCVGLLTEYVFLKFLFFSLHILTPNFWKCGR